MSGLSKLFTRIFLSGYNRSCDGGILFWEEEEDSFPFKCSFSQVRLTHSSFRYSNLHKFLSLDLSSVTLVGTNECYSCCAGMF